MGRKSVLQKGKEKVTDGKSSSAGKRKRDSGVVYDEDKHGKRKDRNVLKFFDDVAYEVDDDDDDDDDFSDDSDFFDEDMMLDEEFGNNAEVANEPARTPQIPVIPKEEELEGEELEQMLRERYKPGSSFVSFAEDNDRRRLFKQDTPVPSLKDPTIWKVKCTVGRERHSAFCLMQKYVDLLTLGTRLHIISAFALDHVKGYVYIEADRQPDVYEACKGLCYIYSSRMTPVPMNEVSHLITARSKSAGINEGMWVRVKSGTYKGDLAQVVAVNDARKKVTVKLIPRIDLQAITNKFGGGVASKKRAVPAPRLIGSAELEDFRPLIQYRKDRDTNLTFEVLDGNVLKDGYLYKKVSTDSLSYWGVQPTEAELLKFEPPENDEPQDVEWLTQLYGDRKKKRIATEFKAGQKGGEKGDGSSSSGMESSFEVDDLVFFGRKDFGIIIGKEEKDDSFKIMKDGSERSVVVNLLPRELKRASFDKKLFTVKDQLANTISIGDMVKVLDGPSKERQGIVKQIYKGVVFLYDQSEQENNGYLCVKGTMCERITGGGGLLKEKGSEPGPSGFADYPSSPKSPLSPEKSWKERDGSSNFKREDKDGMFSVGQSLRIRVGPLKGYLCRVLAIRRFDVTVKLDSQQRILSVKPEHLAEVHQKSSVMSLGVDGDSAKPFDLLGTQDGSEADWLVQGTEGNTGAPPSSTERSSWPAFPASSLSVPTGSVADDTNAGDSAWETRATTQSQNTSWGASGVSERTVTGSGQDDGWSKPDGWGKAATAGTTSGVSGGWGKNVESNQESTEKSMEGSWDKSLKTQGNNVGTAGWGSLSNAPTKPTEGWGSTGGSSAKTEADTSGWKKAVGATGGQGQNSWSKPDAGSSDGASSWGKQAGASSWGKQSDAKAETDWKKQDGGSNKSDTKAAWGQQGAGSSWKKSDGEGGSPWGKKADVNTETDCKKQDGGSSWNRPESKTLSSQQDAGSSWKKSEGEGRSSWGKQSDTKAENNWKSPDGGSSWSKADGSKTSWSKQDDAKSSWNKKNDGSFTTQAGGTSWDKGSGGSAWNKGDVSDRAEDSSKPTWGKQDGGGTSCSKQDTGSSWEGSGGSAWNKKGDGSGGAEDKSTWGKQDGAASWGKQAAGGSESWKKPGAFDCSSKEQEGSWGRPRDFDGGRGSGGRRGRGGWRGGGRDQGGRGRSFNQGQSSSWTTEAEGNNNSAFKGNQSSWNNSQEHSWGNTSFEGSKKADSWSQPVASSKDDDFSEKKQGWNAAKPSGGGGWNATKLSNEGSSSSWNKNSAAEEVGGSGGNQSDWGKKSGEVGGATGWGTSGSNQSAGWDKKIPQKDVEQDENGKNQNDPWSRKKASDGGSSTGGGHSNWKSGTNDSGGTQDSWSSKSNWKSGTSDSGGNQDSWSNKSNWSSGSGFNDNNQQSGTYGDRGGRGGGSWRGGRGGSDRAGYGGRGGSERGGFGGRGGFRGRGSDGGGFRGRGSDGGGFRGRGRGRRDDSGGDWQNRNDSQEDKPYGGWSKGSGSDAEGWKSNNKGSWSQGNSDKGSWKSGDNGGGTGGGWSRGFGSEKNEVGSGSGATSWNNTQGNSWKASATTGGTSSGWGQQSAKEDQNGMGKSWDSGNASTAWTASKSNTEDVDKSKDTSDGPSDAWGKAASSWDKGKISGSQGGW